MTAACRQGNVEQCILKANVNIVFSNIMCWTVIWTFTSFYYFKPLFPLAIYIVSVSYRSLYMRAFNMGAYGHATFHSTSVISWQSALLVVKAGVPGENYRPATGR